MGRAYYYYRSRSTPVPLPAGAPSPTLGSMPGALVISLVGLADPAVAYDVACAPGCAELRVLASLPASSGARLAIDSGLGPFLRNVRYEDGGRWTEAVLREDEVLVAGCRLRPCRVQYTMRLDEAAQKLKDRGRAFAQERMLVAPPSSWLLRPARPPEGGRFRLRVTTPPDTRFASGLFATGAGDYEGTLADLAEAPYSAFGPFTSATVRVGRARVEVAIAPPLARRKADIVRWVLAAAEDVAAYFGEYPVPRALVLVLEGRRPGVGFGTTLGNGGASIMIWVGGQVTPAALASDWVLVHEMTHLALPSVPRENRWWEEGVATYVEPIARAGRGRLSASEVWSGLLDGLPRGLPKDATRGLDESRSWASTYWGGALFAFLADVAIREQTGGRKSLRDALRGIPAAGGTIAVRWDLERTLAAADAATGTTALRDLHARMGRKGGDIDLDAMFARLGVSRRGSTVVFDDKAPLARIRRAMTEGARERR
jgi:hypothetical protein